MAKTIQLFSGSSGNSIYVQSKGESFLIDAGVSAKRIDNALERIDVDPNKLSAIFVTHEHSDHTSGIRVFVKKHKIPVYAPKKSIKKMLEYNLIDGIEEFVKPLEDISMSVCDVKIFRQSHDSVDCVGYRFNLPGNRSIGVCTDTGYVTKEAHDTLLGCDLVYLESNHDINMLRNGPYPRNLQDRILSDYGHLSNETCAEFACELVSSGTTRLVLSHISEKNNFHGLAANVNLKALESNSFIEERDFKLSTAPKENIGKVTTL